MENHRLNHQIEVPLKVQEIDGAPSVQPVHTLKVSNGTLTDNGDGSVSISTEGVVSDGDKGDITVSAGGATWTIDPGVVTLAKQADMATDSVVYRKTAGAGAPEVQTLATLKTDLGLTGTNSGDQTSIVGITGTIAQFNTALSDGDFATGGGTATGTNTGDQTISDTTISISDITTNNATTLAHGFLQKLPGGASTFLRADGAFATPSGTTNSYLQQAFTTQTSVNVVHSFGVYPVVQVIDNTGAVIVPLTITNNTVNDFTVTFDASTTGNILASVGSPQPNSFVSVSDNYTTLSSDKIVKQTASGKIITLLTAVGRTGQEFIIKNSSTGSMTIATTSSQTIDGDLTGMISSDESLTVASDGANWIII
jgi:hypothetical protein